MWLLVFTAWSLHPMLAAPATPADPFAFFRPSIVVGVGDRKQPDRGDPIARVVRGADGGVGVFAAVQVGIDGDRLVAVRGFFGGLVRAFMERRLKKEASSVLLGLRRRLESGEPDH